MNRTELLRQIQATDFALYDVILFLDSHPSDQKALAYYHKTKANMDELVRQYTATFGPLSADSVKSTEYWDWIKEPWPWETGE